jgi:hypothetical protein
MIFNFKPTIDSVKADQVFFSDITVSIILNITHTRKNTHPWNHLTSASVVFTSLRHHFTQKYIFTS